MKLARLVVLACQFVWHGGGVVGDSLESESRSDPELLSLLLKWSYQSHYRQVRSPYTTYWKRIFK